MKPNRCLHCGNGRNAFCSKRNWIVVFYCALSRRGHWTSVVVSSFWRLLWWFTKLKVKKKTSDKFHKGADFTVKSLSQATTFYLIKYKFFFFSLRTHHVLSLNFAVKKRKRLYCYRNNFIKRQTVFISKHWHWIAEGSITSTETPKHRKEYHNEREFFTHVNSFVICSV